MVLGMLSSAAGCGAERSTRGDRAARPQTQPVDRPTGTPAVHEDLIAAVEKLSSATMRDRAARRKALVALAAALDAPLVAERASADKLRELASALERLPPASLDAAPLFHEAFALVLETLAASASDASSTVEYRRALSTLARAVDALGDARRLTDAADEIIAFRAATDAVLMLAGKSAPFRVPAPRAEPPGSLQGYDTELAEARRDVLDLATTSWSDAHLAAARALTSLADVIELVDGCRPAPAAATLRFEARRIRWARAAGVSHSRSIKAGLSAAVDVLDRVQTTEGDLAIKAARLALDNINPRGTLAFQQPVVQDAFRAIVNVFNTVDAPRARNCERAARR
ncbi:MAG: hypothetical protein H0T89_17175 [Deltaproteobacteria bacterium]|nr:hypothetical protein [Deltaproteobacteria bacterium]MDQ3294962.1 hypothetical protein [Myxococcota bacterium]